MMPVPKHPQGAVLCEQLVGIPVGLVTELHTRLARLALLCRQLRTLLSRRAFSQDTRRRRAREERLR